MIKVSKLTALISMLMFGASLFIFTAPADAKVKIYDKDGKSLKLGFRIQARLRLLNEAETPTSTTTTGRDYDFDFRRMRIAGSGKLNDMISFAAQTDIGGGTAQAANHGVEWRDALVTLKFSDAARLSFGLFKVQFTRSRNGSGFGQMALDRPFVESTVTDTSDVDGGIGGKRDQQIALWGNLDKFQYRIALGDGATTKGGSKDSLRMAARVHYAVWDKEGGLGYKETYLGKKKILTIGAGYDSQADVNGVAGNAKANTATTFDVTYENPLDNGGVPNFNAAYYTRDVGASTSSSEGKGYHVTLGYLLPGGGLQPYVRYATWDTDSTGSGNSGDKTVMNAGLNYLMKGSKAKIVFDWENIDFDKEGTTKPVKDHSIITMQWQLDF